jgi:lipopolysaccharide biosynthesis glycosyltransferase
MTTETIHVAFCIDDAYALPMSVTLRSLLAHTKRPVRAHVIDGGLSPASVQKIKNDAGDCVRIVSPVARSRELHASPLSVHWSGALLLRLELHELLADVPRVLSLDADLLVMDDIGKLWDEGIAPSCPVRMALSSLAPFGYPALREHGFAPGALHFNSGIMDLNLDVLRTRMHEAVRVLEAHPTLLFPEMDAFNIAFQSEIGRIASRWHVQLHSYYRIFGAETAPARLAGLIDQAEANEAVSAPGLVHFLERWKPWHSDAEENHGEFAVAWRRFAMETTWASEVDGFARSTTSARVKKALKEALGPLGTLAERREAVEAAIGL